MVSAEKQVLNKMIDELPEDMVSDIIRYLELVQRTKKNSIFKELEQASSSSLDFWNNAIDDEAWNNV